MFKFRPQGSLLTLAFATAMTSVAHSQSYVDPYGGLDTNPGTQAQPWQTISWAVTQAPAASTIFLEDGNYDWNSGESFPIHVPYSVALTGVNECGAKVHDNIGIASSVFETDAIAVAFENFEIESVTVATSGSVVFNQPCIEIAPSSQVVSQVILENMSLVGPIGIRYDESNLGTGKLDFLDVHNTRMTIGNRGINCRWTQNHTAPVAPIVNVRATKLEYSSSSTSLLKPSTGITVRTAEAGEANVLIEDSVVAGFFNGTEVRGGPGLSLDVAHSTYQGNGEPLLFGGSPGGAITEAGATGNASIDIVRTIFNDTFGGRELPDYNASTYSLTRCIVEQPILLGVGGSFAKLGALFVDAAGGDYHLRPGSSAIDTGMVPAAMCQEDFDGFKRSPVCLPTSVDIGADEFIPDYIYLADPMTIGGATRVRLIATPGDIFGIFVGFYGPVLPFGGSCGLQALCGAQVPPAPASQVPGAVGLVPASGIAEVSVTMPNNPALLGETLFWAGAMLTPTTLRQTQNLHLATFCE